MCVVEVAVLGLRSGCGSEDLGSFVNGILDPWGGHSLFVWKEGLGMVIVGFSIDSPTISGRLGCFLVVEVRIGLELETFLGQAVFG